MKKSMIIVGLLLMTYPIFSQIFKDPTFELRLKKKIGKTLEDPKDLELVLEEILQNRAIRNQLVSKQKKNKFRLSENITSIAFSINQRVMLFQKKIISDRQSGELILYDANQKVIRSYPFLNPKSLAQQKKIIIDRFQLIEGNLLVESNKKRILDHPKLPTKIILKIKKPPQKRQNTLSTRLDINLVDGRNQILGGSFYFDAALKQPPNLSKMYFSSDGMIVAFIISYQALRGHLIEKREKIIGLNLDSIIRNKALMIKIQDHFRLSLKQKNLIFLSKEFFDLEQKLSHRYDYFHSGLRKEIYFSSTHPNSPSDS